MKTKKTNILTRVFILALSVLLGFMAIMTAGCNSTEPAEKATVPTFNIETTATNGISLFSSEAVATANNTVSKTLTATVLPEQAEDKRVDWAIAWETNPFGDSAVVTDYVTVTPNSDGSNVATVTAHKGFVGATMKITCTTRVGGFTAECTVKYVGKPETVYLSGNGQTYNAGAVIKLAPRSTYVFDTILDNTLGAVDSKYDTGAVKNILSANSIVHVEGTFNFLTDEGQVAPLPSATLQPVQGAFFTATLSNNKLTITTKLAPCEHEMFHSYYTGSDFTIKEADKSDSVRFTIKLTFTGYEEPLNFSFYIKPSASSVSLDNTTLSF